MKVKTYCINEGTASQYYGLKNAESGQVLYAAPNNWKTEKGAQRWAEKRGMEVIKKQSPPKNRRAFYIYSITNRLTPRQTNASRGTRAFYTLTQEPPWQV